MQLSWTVLLVSVYLTFFPVTPADIRQQLLQQQKGTQGSNQYLDQFLDAHARPRINFNSKNFELTVDDRFKFKPQIKTDVIRTTGEPWPMPRKYVTKNDRVVRLNRPKFRMNILKRSCDILEEAIKRYMKVVLEQSLEEPYSFYFNYNEKTAAHWHAQQQQKYQHISDLAKLDIFVSGEDHNYPHLDMDETYNLTVKEGVGRLDAREVWGALRGLETFSQLVFRKFGTDELYARETEIEDRPRFPHRGILVDTSRHYIDKHVLKNVIDGMSYNKLNTVHWHIVDDNSFPYQSKVFPDLSAKGAFHPDLVYTISDIKEIVEYARLRGVRIVPEFDTPGHTFAWLGAPEIKAACYAGGHKIEGPIGPINPVSDVTFDFFRKLFTELYEVFPDTFFHLGGDELHSECWATNPEIVDALDKNGIPKSEKNQGQNYINKAIGYYFNRLLKTLKDTSVKSRRNASFIMWEDVYKNTRQIQKDSIMEVWYGKQINVKTYNDAGYRALYSSCWYLDNYLHGVSWHTYYQCEPSPYSTEEEEKGKLLGGEACLWAEYITSDTLMTFMWPRASAPAERLWSARGVTDMNTAARRLNEQRCRMIYRGLTTGHAGGPDYCPRPKKMTASDDMGYVETNNAAGRPYGMKDQDNFRLMGRDVSLSVLSEYHSYLPMFNLLFSALGLYLICTAFSVWRSRNGRKK